MRMRSHAGNMDFAASQMDEEQDRVGDQSTLRPHLRREEVRRDQHLQVRADKLPPRRRFLAGWGWGNSVPFQEVPNRLSTDRVAQIGQSTGNTVIAPTAILLGEAYDQGFQRLVDWGTPQWLTIERTIELLGNELAMPSQNRVG